jgi:hypothetical protein
MEYYSSIFGETQQQECEDGEPLTEDLHSNSDSDPNVDCRSFGTGAEAEGGGLVRRVWSWASVLLLPLFLGLFIKFPLYTSVGLMVYVLYRLLSLFWEE